MTATYTRSSAQGIRHTRNYPCKVCGGYKEIPQHISERCWGVEYDKTIICTREQYAGQCKVTSSGNSWTHWKEGRCACGVDHATGQRAPISWDTSWVSTSRPSPYGNKSRGNAAATTSETVRVRDYSYLDSRGELVAIHRRSDYVDGRKSFAWVTKDRHSGAERHSLGGLPMASIPLYELADIMAAPAGSLFGFAEGEKACEALRDRGIPATCLGSGANGMPQPEVLAPLAGKVVCLWPDADPQGLAWMARIAEMLHGIAARVTWLEIPGAGKGDDAADWVGTDAECVEMIVAAPVWSPPIPDVPDATQQPTEPHRARGRREPREDAKALLERVSYELDRGGEYVDSMAVRDCRTRYTAGRCASCGTNIAKPISCKNVICPQCMPGRMMADWNRGVGPSVAGQQFRTFRLRPKESLAALDEPLRIARQRFTEARTRHGDLQGGFIAVVWDPGDGAQILLALHEASLMPSTYVSFNVEPIEDLVTGDQVAGWLSNEYVAEIDRWVSAQALLTDARDARDGAARYLRAIRGRHRFQGFGAYYRTPKAGDTPSCRAVEDMPDNSGYPESDEPVRVSLGALSGGNYQRKKGDRDTACWNCGEFTVDWSARLTIGPERLVDHGPGKLGWR